MIMRRFCVILFFLIMICSLQNISEAADELTNTIQYTPQEFVNHCNYINLPVTKLPEIKLTETKYDKHYKEKISEYSSDLLASTKIFIDANENGEILQIYVMQNNNLAASNLAKQYLIRIISGMDLSTLPQSPSQSYNEIERIVTYVMKNRDGKYQLIEPKNATGDFILTHDYPEESDESHFYWINS